MSKTTHILTIFYDLPSKTKEDKKLYAKFFSELKKMGFYQLQESVYIKPLSEESKESRYLNLIKNISPPNGNIRTLLLTHNAFKKLGILVGEKTLIEKLLEQGSSVLVL